MFRIEVIPHNEQRYNTVGDWQFIGDDLVIKISDTKNMTYNSLIALHEFVEAMECKFHGITTEMVDKWDMEHLDSDDPGALLGCPYYAEHAFADIVEYSWAKNLDVNWNDYEDALNKLGQE